VSRLKYNEAVVVTTKRPRPRTELDSIELL